MSESESLEELRQRQRDAVVVAKFRTGIREERWTQIAAMREAGLTQREIAKRLGVTQARIFQILKRHRSRQNDG